MQFLDPQRAERFLAELRRSGNAHKAAAAASPGCAGPSPGYTTFRDRWRRDAAFRVAWDAALADYRTKVRRKGVLCVAVIEAVEAA